MKRINSWLMAGAMCLASALAVWPADSRAAPAGGGSDPLDKATCLECHDGSKEIEVTDADGETTALTAVEKDKLDQGVHGKMQCVACHTDIVDSQENHQKAAGIAKPDCTSCHEQLLTDASQGKVSAEVEGLRRVAEKIEAYKNSFHARPDRDNPDRPKAYCRECHATHEFNVPKQGTPGHGEWRTTIPKACGESCHEDQLEDFEISAHGELVMGKGDPKGAVCSDCHTSHEITTSSADSFKLQNVEFCGGCHEKQLSSYRDTYHGKVNKLGYTNTAKCSDCHGSHLILASDNPESDLHPDSRLATCGECHNERKGLAEPTEGFLSFGAHATTDDFENYPQMWIAAKFMAALLIGVFAFFWVHCGLWYYREWKDRKEGKTVPHVKTAGMDLPQKHVRRFAAGWRVAHLVFALSLMTLTLTGMSLMFSESAWAPKVAAFMGGAETMGHVHRTAAVVFAAIFVGHIVYVALHLWRVRKTFRWFGPDSLLPNWKDWHDLVGMFKWFFGKGPRPKFERWAYFEKFDYWAPFWGVNIVGFSGLMMWFPHITAEYLPGWVFNVALLVHGEEAFLAAVFLFTVHFFNNHFRPDKLPPPDVVMFTGTVPLEEFRREHAAQYERMVASGELEQYLVDAPSRPMHVGSVILGIVLIAFGLTLLALVVSGFIGSL